jgi:hypothetical protein
MTILRNFLSNLLTQVDADLIADEDLELIYQFCFLYITNTRRRRHISSNQEENPAALENDNDANDDDVDVDEIDVDTAAPVTEDSDGISELDLRRYLFLGSYVDALSRGGDGAARLTNSTLVEASSQHLS